MRTMRTTLVLILFLAGIAAVQADTPLTVPDPGFEGSLGADAVPKDWSFTWQSTHMNDAQRGIQKQRPDFGADTAVKHSGQRSFRIGVVRAVDDGVLSTDVSNLPAGIRSVRLSAWVRTANMNGGAAFAGLVFIGDHGKWLGANYGSITVADNEDWTHHVGFALLPRGTTQIKIKLWMNFNYKGTGTAWFDDIALIGSEQDSLPPTRYVDTNPPPAPTAVETARGFMVWSRDTVRIVFPNSVPAAAERLSEIAVSACPGEIIQQPVCIRALRRPDTDLKQVRADLKRVRQMTVTAGKLTGPGGAVIPNSDVKVLAVKFATKRGQDRWGPYASGDMVVPLYLEERDTAAVAAGENAVFRVQISVPEQAAAGTYHGTVTVRAGEGGRQEIPISLTVRGFRLAKPKGVCFGMYARTRDDAAVLKDYWTDMRAHGMTSIGLCGNLDVPLTVEDGKVTVKWPGTTAFERSMDMYRDTGFPEPVVWLMGHDAAKFALTQGKLESDAFASAYRAVIMAILARAKERNWPEIIFQPVDEPFEHEELMDEGTRCLQILKSIPGVRTEEDGCNGAPAALERMYPFTDILVLHDGPVTSRGHYDAAAWNEFRRRCAADHKTIWFYNIDLTGWHAEPMRFMYGFGLWQSGARGVIEWAYMFPVTQGKEDAVYARPDAMLFRFPRTAKELGGPTIGYEAIRDGITDYRYLLTFRQLCNQAAKDSRAETRNTAARLWSAVQTKLDAIDFHGCEGLAAQGDWTGAQSTDDDGARTVSGDHKVANGWQLGEYDALRTQIAAGIEQLRGMIGSEKN